MKSFRGVLATVIVATFVSPAFADNVGTISEIRVLAAGGGSADGIVVTGTFTPSLGCPQPGFMLYSTDPYFAQSYALLLAAKASGATIKFVNSYCMPNGYARGNGYAMAD
jgi:hypothetical protein